MNPLIPLACLVVVLVGYRLAEPGCRWLYSRWRWSDSFREMGERVIEGIANGIRRDMLYNAEFWIAKPEWDESEKQWTYMGTIGAPITFDGWQYASGTGEVRE